MHIGISRLGPASSLAAVLCLNVLAAGCGTDMNENTPTVATFWDQLQADVAQLGEVHVWRIGLFLLVGAVLGLYIRLLYDRLGQSAADSDSVARV